MIERAEAEGWDGVALTDSQNLTGDPYVALALGARATSRIGLATGVTNPVTRHPAATASAIATVQEISQGRAVLGIGRGDSSLFHLGQEPARARMLERYVHDLQCYLRGDAVDLDGYPSRMRWLPTRQPKVPVDVAATGPRVTAIAARLADRVTFAVGADPDRIRRGIALVRTARAEAGLSPDLASYGAYVNVAPHPDVAVARALVRGGAATMAHFSGMAGSTPEGQRPEDRAVFEALHARYDRERHTLASAAHVAVLDDAFLERFAVIGPPKICIERLRALAEAGVDRLVVTGGSFDADRDAATHSRLLFVREVLPALQGR
jgi:5,10-methylenetetrahydromethanopterin reductase